MHGKEMAAAARGNEWGNGTLGAPGASGCSYKGWAAPAGPRAPHATAAPPVREEEKPPWKEDEPQDTARRGLARKGGAYRFAPAGLRGEQERWAEGKELSPFCEGFYLFTKIVTLQEFWRTK